MQTVVNFGKLLATNEIASFLVQQPLGNQLGYMHFSKGCYGVADWSLDLCDWGLK